MSDKPGVPRSFESQHLDWLWHMAATATTPAAKELWKGRYLKEGGQPDALP